MKQKKYRIYGNGFQVRTINSTNHHNYNEAIFSTEKLIAKFTSVDEFRTWHKRQLAAAYQLLGCVKAGEFDEGSDWNHPQSSQKAFKDAYHAIGDLKLIYKFMIVSLQHKCVGRAWKKTVKKTKHSPTSPTWKLEQWLCQHYTKADLYKFSKAKGFNKYRQIMDYLLKNYLVPSELHHKDLILDFLGINEEISKYK